VEDVKQQQHSVHADDVFEHGAVVDPDCPDRQEAHCVGEVRRSEMEEFCPERCAGWWHFDFEYQQGDGDRKNTVAKCLQACGIHTHLLCE